MTEQTARVIEAGEQPVRDNDGLHRRRGIWEFRVKLPNGQVRAFSTKTRIYNDARKVRQAKLKELASGRMPSDMSKWTLAKAIEAWRASRTQCTSPGTQALERFKGAALVREFPVATLGAITPAVIRTYQTARRQRAAAATVNSELRLLRGVLKRAKLWAAIADDVKLLKEPQQGPGRALKPEEETALFRTAASRPEWQVAYWTAMLAANTTMRGGEIKGLRLADIDWAARRLTVRRSTTKTDAGCRLIPLNAAAYWAVGKLLERAQALGANKPEHYLLPLTQFHQTKTGQPSAGTGFDPSQPMRCWRTAWRKLTAKAGLPGLRFHDLRHHAITRMAEAGVADQTLMALAGHVSRAMLEHYSHVRTEAKQAAVDLISTAIPAAVEPEASSAVQ